MNYYIDTEFIEGFHKPPFGKKRHFIDLISIGIVAEDGREYYAISNEFNPKDADKWVRDNVIKPIFVELSAKTGSGYPGLTSMEIHRSFDKMMAEAFANDGGFTDKNVLMLLKKYGKSNKQIAKEIIEFCNNEKVKIIENSNVVSLSDEAVRVIRQGYTEPTFYGYYADYDWVLFCSLFGRMIDLPKGFPMYCIDLKQNFDEKNAKSKLALEFATLESIKELDGYPKQTKEHNALNDAKWNMELHKFLNTL